MILTRNVSLECQRHSPTAVVTRKNGKRTRKVNINTFVMIFTIRRKKEVRQSWGRHGESNNFLCVCLVLLCYLPCEKYQAYLYSERNDLAKWEILVMQEKGEFLENILDWVRKYSSSRVTRWKVKYHNSGANIVKNLIMGAHGHFFNCVYFLSWGWRWRREGPCAASQGWGLFIQEDGLMRDIGNCRRTAEQL